MKKQTKAVRIRKLILAGFRDVAIAKLVKCHANYVYIVRTKMAETMPMVKPKNLKEVNSLLQRQVVEKKKFSEFDASPKAIAWKKQNPWFGVDKDKTDYAIGLCMEAHTKNIDPKSSKYYTFIDQGMLNYVPPRKNAHRVRVIQTKRLRMMADAQRKEADALDHWENAVAPKSILDEAKDIIYGDREKTYGAPDKNLKAIAGYWANHLHTRFGVYHDVTPEDVCIMMVLLKAARLGNDITHRDSQVDAVGYLALMERIQK